MPNMSTFRALPATPLCFSVNTESILAITSGCCPQANHDIMPHKRAERAGVSLLLQLIIHSPLAS